MVNLANYRSRSGRNAGVLLLSAILIVVLASSLMAGCVDNSGPEPLPEPLSEEESSQALALIFLQNDPTFKFDGLEDTLKLVSSAPLESKTSSWQFEYEFQCANLGYGDRSGESLAVIVTPHGAQIIVQDGEITQAMLDDVWDMLSQTKTKSRVMIQPMPGAEGVVELIQELGGILRNSYRVGNDGIIITADLPEEALTELSSDPRVFLVRPADKLRVVIELNQPLNNEIEALIRTLGGDVRYAFLGDESRVSANLPEEAMEKLSSDPRIINVRPIAWGKILQDDLTWNVDRIDAEKVWGGYENATDVASGRNAGDGIKVAILDSGIDYYHNDLYYSYYGGYDFVNNDTSPWDDNGHGTAVAGIIAAQDDGYGVIGVAPKVKS